MTDNDEGKRFLAEGLAHYAEAVLATSEFRRQVIAILERAIDDAEQAGVWEPGSLRKTITSKEDHVAAPYFSVWRVGRFRKKADLYLEAGLWWTNLRGTFGPTWFGNVASAGKAPQMRALATDSGLTKKGKYLYRPASTSEDLLDQATSFIAAIFKHTD